MKATLQRIEGKIDTINEHVIDLKAGRAANKAKLEGHATQLAILWTIVLGLGGSAAALLIKFFTE